MPKKKLLFLVFIGVLSNVYGGEPLPVVPVNPDRHDCYQLSHQFNLLISKLSHAAYECVSKGPVYFGYNHNGHQRAYAQCVPIEEEGSFLEKERTQRYGDCIALADQRLQREKDEQKLSDAAKKEEQIKAEAVKKGNDFASRAKDTYELVQDPVKFFTGALSPRSELYKKLFSSGKNQVRADTGQEIYRYLQGVANVGSSSNGIIGSIQKSSLDELSRYHKKLMSDFNSTMAQMDEIAKSDSKPSGRPSPFKPFSPPPRPTTQNEDCAIFRDTAASRALMDSDMQRWMALNEACK